LSRATPVIRRFGIAVAFLPVIAPPIALGVGVQVLAIRARLGGSWLGVLVAHVVPASGYLTLFLIAVLANYDVSMEDAARSLGATPWAVFRRVTLPALRAPLAQCVALGALVSWGQLALTLVVGGGVVRSLPVELLAFVQSGDDRLGAAAALLLTIPPALVLGVSQSGARRTGAVA
jgi:putative spermidine/putrescine transport system permease protein